MREHEEWVDLRRRLNKNQTGGGHVYIDSETLNIALENAGIPLDIPLMVKRYPARDAKGTAKIILKIKPTAKVTEEHWRKKLNKT